MLELIRTPIVFFVLIPFTFLTLGCIALVTTSRRARRTLLLTAAGAFLLFASWGGYLITLLIKAISMPYPEPPDLK